MYTLGQKKPQFFLGSIFFIQGIVRHNLFFIHCLVHILRYHTAKFYEFSPRIDEYIALDAWQGLIYSDFKNLLNTPQIIIFNAAIRSCKTLLIFLLLNFEYSVTIHTYNWKKYYLNNFGLFEALKTTKICIFSTIVKTYFTVSCNNFFKSKFFWYIKKDNIFHR